MGKKFDILQLHQLLVVPEHKLVLIRNFQPQAFPLYFHCYSTQEQLKLTTYSLPYELQNLFKLLIMLPKIKALLEGDQQLYTKISTAQIIVFIQRRDGYFTRYNLVTRVPVDFNQYIAYLTTTHRPIKGDRSFKPITSKFVSFHPNLLDRIQG